MVDGITRNEDQLTDMCMSNTQVHTPARCDALQGPSADCVHAKANAIQDKGVTYGDRLLASTMRAAPPTVSDTSGPFRCSLSLVAANQRSSKV